MNALCDYPLAWPTVENDPGQSSCVFEILSGPSLTVWMVGHPGQETRKDLQFKLAPDHPVIIGRAEGGGVPYLDPAYYSTTLIPGTGDTILRSNGDGRDRAVSRAHFMLRAIAGGIQLVNGVPKVGGGIRPPRNGTRLIYPRNRDLRPEEVLFVESLDAVVIVLPNGTNVRILAE